MKTTKKCSKCGTVKPTTEFYLRNSRSTGLVSACKVCTENYRKANRNTTKDTNAYLIRTYNIDLKDYERILDNQGGVCAICSTSVPGGNNKRLSVDHCHTTGKVRGLLCRLCNAGIGKLKDDPALTRKATEYLERHA